MKYAFELFSTDKLIPKTSKEFLNTLRVVSTISPQNSDEQIVSPEHDKPNSGSRRRTCERKVVDISSRIDLTKSEDDESPSDVEHGGKKRAMMPGRSYKEVCLFGHSSAPPSARVCSSAGPQEKPLMPDYRWVHQLSVWIYFFTRHNCHGLNKNSLRPQIKLMLP